ncbi:permease [Anaerocolumna sp. MB42-C2]|uniref:permease n=1 Tax=Anaerocolumna sp. MB42-C2 TaxID=3070997 RepID=UPI0027DEBB11|nr:permease [Anaerocolumna sp. MB42-C2]WMJ88026.1 permease [Anaerocolumna sp. MB42-C2]
MAAYIDVITGFLESGKTSFIKEIIDKNSLMEYDKTVLLVCEEGFTDYEKELLTNHRIELIIVNDESDLNHQLFQRIKREYSPDYIMIEFNGTWDINALFSIKTPFNYSFRNVIFVSDATKFTEYLKNMASIIQPHILNSDIVAVNRHEQLSKKQKKYLQLDIKNINRKTEIIYAGESSEINMIEKYFAPFEKHIKISKGIIAFTILFACTAILPDFMLIKLYENLQSTATIFLSILIEAIPFILLGAFISSIIQIFIPSGWIMKKMSGQRFSSFLAASLAGIFMPICDCGTVPIVLGLLKKGTPLPQTLIFWLASSAVNPVVLMTVYYAFPDKPYLVFLRMYAGILIALVTGLILSISKIETKDVINHNNTGPKIGSDILDLKYEGKIGKLEAVVKGARLEFFRVMKYLIIGAFLSSFLQTVLSQTLKNLLSTNLSLQFLIMIAASIFMSTCSTSNAFIGRSFLKNISIMPVMSFIVLGPMLDFKNMLMLSETIKKKYLLLFALIVSLLGYLLFYTITLLL